MDNDKIYQKNFEVFARRFNPVAAYRLEKVDCENLKFCKTISDELNLVKTDNKTSVYLHSEFGALKEASQLFASLPSKDIQVLYIYGLGLGYFYEASREWLHGKKDRYLIFLEDDARVLHRFLETPEASKLLSDSHVFIHFFSIPDHYEWGKLRRDFFSIIWPFANKKAFITALPSYFFSRFNFFDQLNSQLYLHLSMANDRIWEFTVKQDFDFANFYFNMPYIGESYLAKEMYGTCFGMPALICGAGPSLKKQLPIIKKLKDKAIIFGSGSAMSILNQEGIMPHFGGAVDPFQTQEVRQLANFAYEVPFFYHNRFHKEAFKQLHGPRLYVNGTGGFNTADWFEEYLGIQSQYTFISGVSTTNFLLEVSMLLGCNPIILVGVDLAYSNRQRYAAGVKVHPTASEIEKKKVQVIEVGLIPVKGLDGPNIFTTGQWLHEAAAITAFRQRHPQIEVINCTEGGMPILDVPNRKLEEVINEKLTRQFDFQSWIHGLIQNAMMPKDTSEKVVKSLLEWQSSLERCLKYCNQSDFLSEIELEKEPAYRYLLEQFNGVFHILTLLEKENLRKWFQFLKKYVRFHLQALKKGLRAYETYQKNLLKPKIVNAQDNSEILAGKPRRKPLYFCYPEGSVMLELYIHKELLYGPFT